MKVIYEAADGKQFDNEKDCIAYENLPAIYCIKNTTSEFSSEFTRFCSTLAKAKEELENCCNWYSRNGTGKIYKIILDTGCKPKYELVFERE